MKKLVKQEGNIFRILQVEDSYLPKNNETFFDLDKNIVKPKIENSEWVETATAEEIKKTYLENMRRDIKNVYNKFSYDGLEFNSKIEIDIILLAKTGVLTNNQAVDLGDLLKKTFDWVVKGQWLSAKKQIDNITTPAEFVIFVNNIKNEIENYINNNY